MEALFIKPCCRQPRWGTGCRSALDLVADLIQSLHILVTQFQVSGGQKGRQLLRGACRGDGGCDSRPVVEPGQGYGGQFDPVSLGDVVHEGL